MDRRGRWNQRRRFFPLPLNAYDDGQRQPPLLSASRVRRRPTLTWLIGVGLAVVQGVLLVHCFSFLKKKKKKKKKKKRKGKERKGCEGKKSLSSSTSTELDQREGEIFLAPPYSGWQRRKSDFARRAPAEHRSRERGREMRARTGSSHLLAQLETPPSFRRQNSRRPPPPQGARPQRQAKEANGRKREPGSAWRLPPAVLENRATRRERKGEVNVKERMTKGGEKRMTKA